MIGTCVAAARMKSDTLAAEAAKFKRKFDFLSDSSSASAGTKE
jgi:hypothetical protein